MHHTQRFMLFQPSNIDHIVTDVYIVAALQDTPLPLFTCCEVSSDRSYIPFHSIFLVIIALLHSEVQYSMFGYK